MYAQEMDYLKGQKQSSVAGAETTVPALARHENQPLLPTSDNHCTLKRHGTLSLFSLSAALVVEYYIFSRI